MVSACLLPCSCWRLSPQQPPLQSRRVLLPRSRAESFHRLQRLMGAGMDRSYGTTSPLGKQLLDQRWEMKSYQQSLSKRSPASSATLHPVSSACAQNQENIYQIPSASTVLKLPETWSFTCSHSSSLQRGTKLTKSTSETKSPRNTDLIHGIKWIHKNGSTKPVDPQNCALETGRLLTLKSKQDPCPTTELGPQPQSQEDALHGCQTPRPP